MPGVYTESRGKKDGFLVLITKAKRRMSLWFAYPSCPRRVKKREASLSLPHPYTAMGLSAALPTLLLAQPLTPLSLPEEPWNPEKPNPRVTSKRLPGFSPLSSSLTTVISRPSCPAGPQRQI